MRRITLCHLVLAVLGGLQAGCPPLVWETEDRRRLDEGVAGQATPLASSAAYRDSIDASAYLEGMTLMRVRGYGLVVGLGNNGSRDCPKTVFDSLVQSMYKQRRTAGQVVGVTETTPERLISSVDTAVVIVSGEIPPAGTVKQRFDVSVAALPGTQTKSLRGGRLLPTELNVFRSVAEGKSITGRVLAHARGPLFLNPFSDEESATKSSPLQGTVLGGGVVMEDRSIRLVLFEPSHGRVRAVQDRINAHFPGSHRIADARSPAIVQLRVPDEYVGDETHFLGLVRSLYLRRDPAFESVRARQLGEELLRPGAPHPRIALAFEGLGRAALPVLAELYAHPKDYVSFHAAVAGLRLGEHIACDAVVKHARDPRSVYRFQAVRALADAERMGSAAVALRALLSDEDPRVQIAAYESLIKRGDTTIKTALIGDDNFVLDEVPTSSTRFVYAKRSTLRRIAIFGLDARSRPPILYRAPDGIVTMTAGPDDSHLTVIRAVGPTGATSPPVPVAFALPALIRMLGGEAEADVDGAVTGLGVDYGAIVRAMYQLSRDGALNAKFVLEQPNAAELFGPRRPVGRPESEL